jgi:hypothetical protein
LAGQIAIVERISLKKVVEDAYVEPGSPAPNHFRDPHAKEVDLGTMDSSLLIPRRAECRS